MEIVDSYLSDWIYATGGQLLNLQRAAKSHTFQVQVYIGRLYHYCGVHRVGELG